jgi:hypothetical protein
MFRISVEEEKQKGKQAVKRTRPVSQAQSNGPAFYFLIAELTLYLKAFWKEKHTRMIPWKGMEPIAEKSDEYKLIHQCPQIRTKKKKCAQVSGAIIKYATSCFPLSNLFLHTCPCFSWLSL